MRAKRMTIEKHSRSSITYLPTRLREATTRGSDLLKLEAYLSSFANKMGAPSLNVQYVESCALQDTFHKAPC